MSRCVFCGQTVDSLKDLAPTRVGEKAGDLVGFLSRRRVSIPIRQSLRDAAGWSWRVRRDVKNVVEPSPTSRAVLHTVCNVPPKSIGLIGTADDVRVR